MPITTQSQLLIVQRIIKTFVCRVDEDSGLTIYLSTYLSVCLSTYQSTYSMAVITINYDVRGCNHADDKRTTTTNRYYARLHHIVGEFH